MAGFEKAKVIDGFSSIQAVRRKGGGGETDGPRLRKSSAKLPEQRPDGENRKDGAFKQARIGHTALPPKYEIICYGCSYAFTVTGRLHKVICPKCREQLDVGDYVVDGVHTDSIRTIGTVTVKAGGVLRGVSVIARDLVLAGGLVEDCHIRTCGCVLFGEHGYYRDTSICTRDVVIGAGARVVFRAPLTCRTLNVNGDVKGRLSCEAAMTVHPGGIIRGEIVTAHLVVNEGGGLKAKLRVGPRDASKSGSTGKRDSMRTWELPPVSAPGRKRRARRAAQPELPVDVPPETVKEESVIKEDSDGQETRTG